EMGDRRQLRAADSLRDAQPRAPAPGAGEPQPAVAGLRHGGGAPGGPGAKRLRAADALRHGGRGETGPGGFGLSLEDLHALRRIDTGHGVPGAATFGAYVERSFFAGQLWRQRLG